MARSSTGYWSRASNPPKAHLEGLKPFNDGVQFDPENPTAYLNSLPIKKQREYD